MQAKSQRFLNFAGECDRLHAVLSEFLLRFYRQLVAYACGVHANPTGTGMFQKVIEDLTLDSVRGLFQHYYGAGKKSSAQLFNDVKHSQVALDAEAEALTAQWETAKAEKSDAEKREKEAKNKLEARIGASTFGELPDGRKLSYKTTERAGYVVNDTKFRTLRIEKMKAAKKGSK